MGFIFGLQQCILWFKKNRHDFYCFTCYLKRLVVSFGNFAKGRQLDVENAVSDVRCRLHLADYETPVLIVECNFMFRGCSACQMTVILKCRRMFAEQSLCFWKLELTSWYHRWITWLRLVLSQFLSIDPLATANTFSYFSWCCCVDRQHVFAAYEMEIDSRLRGRQWDSALINVHFY